MADRERQVPGPNIERPGRLPIHSGGVAAVRVGVVRGQENEHGHQECDNF